MLPDEEALQGATLESELGHNPEISLVASPGGDGVMIVLLQPGQHYEGGVDYGSYGSVGSGSLLGDGVGYVYPPLGNTVNKTPR